MKPIPAEAAETLALNALTWLVGNEELLSVFLGSTGASAADLRALATDVDFLTSVLGFLMLDDAWIVAFCDAHSVSYDRPAMAHMVLTGETNTHWT